MIIFHNYISQLHFTIAFYDSISRLYFMTTFHNCISRFHFTISFYDSISRFHFTIQLQNPDFYLLGLISVFWSDSVPELFNDFLVVCVHDVTPSDDSKKFCFIFSVNNREPAYLL